MFLIAALCCRYFEYNTAATVLFIMTSLSFVTGLVIIWAINNTIRDLRSFSIPFDCARAEIAENLDKALKNHDTSFLK